MVAQLNEPVLLVTAVYFENIIYFQLRVKSEKLKVVVITTHFVPSNSQRIFESSFTNKI
ncbi:hypothetical protein UT300019_29660 [Clostridium sp. CTA-19]